jgi:flagellar transcriptional activator FlhD
MEAADASKEIADLNLNYLLLAQKLLRQDRSAGMLRLGVSPGMADLLGSMPLAEVIKLAACNFLLCAFRLDELPGVQSMLQPGRDNALQQAHLAILLAGAHRQAAPAAR